MRFAVTHPLVTHPYHPDLVTGAGIAAVATAAEAAGFHGFGFTDHPAPSQRWLDGGGHDALDPFVALDVLKAIWTGDDVSFEGRHFNARGDTSHPRPVSDPHPPIWIGGNSGQARQRVADRGDGWCPFPAARA